MAEIKLARSLETYARCVPESVASGSSSQMVFFVEDAKKDIATLASRIEELEELGRQSICFLEAERALVDKQDARIIALTAALAPFRKVAGRLFEQNGNANDLVLELPHVAHQSDVYLTGQDFFNVARALGDADEDHSHD